ncbi:MAG: ATP-binding protein [Limnoraphis robusta]|jgi:SpoVK/Ycf46/Vps4 family AAA+-type ATPase
MWNTVLQVAVSVIAGAVIGVAAGYGVPAIVKATQYCLALISRFLDENWSDIESDLRQELGNLRKWLIEAFRRGSNTIIKSDLKRKLGDLKKWLIEAFRRGSNIIIKSDLKRKLGDLTKWLIEAFRRGLNSLIALVIQRNTNRSTVTFSVAIEDKNDILLPPSEEQRIMPRSNGNKKLNNNQQETEKSDQAQESTIDINLYLREPKYRLKDVILLPETRYQVDLIIAELKDQDLIYKRWGMGEKHKLDQALSINFYSPPGTVKTHTAEALAHVLDRNILVVPYQQIESKYVGETPNTISDVFKFATEKNAILFFDEADSFLDKRLENATQVVNTAVSLTRSIMLTQLSEYEGVVIFATNLICNYDPAFINLVRRTVEFKLPDEEERVKMWEAQIPEKLPLDNSVDFEELAKQFDQISGRDIKNAVLKAVVAAAHEDKPDEEKKVTQSHFAKAITEIIVMKKSLEKPQSQLAPVNEEVELPPKPLDTTSEPVSSKGDLHTELPNSPSNN